MPPSSSCISTLSGSAGRTRRALVVALLSCALLACERGESAPTGAEQELVVFAATSLKDAFTELAAEFRRSHTGVGVQLNFAGTQELHTQLDHGAAADVFASADQHHMQDLQRARRVEKPVTFARNEPVLVISRERREQIRRFSELPLAERIILGVPEVPIGRYSLQILERANATLGNDFRARVEAKVISRELNVRQVLAKVSLGEADAGIVYRSDVRSVGERVSVVSIPSELNVVAEYPIALVTGARHPRLAREWLTTVLSDAGRAQLRAAGFLPPTR